LMSYFQEINLSYYNRLFKRIPRSSIKYSVFSHILGFKYPMDSLFAYSFHIIKKTLVLLKPIGHISHLKVLFDNVYLADLPLTRASIQIFVLHSFMKVLLMG